MSARLVILDKIGCLCKGVLLVSHAGILESLGNR